VDEGCDLGFLSFFGIHQTKIVMTRSLFFFPFRHVKRTRDDMREAIGICSCESLVSDEHFKDREKDESLTRSFLSLRDAEIIVERRKGVGSLSVTSMTPTELCFLSY